MKNKNNPIAAIGGTAVVGLVFHYSKKMVKKYTGNQKHLFKRRKSNTIDSLNIFRKRK